jgi:hypothetical protein
MTKYLSIYSLYIFSIQVDSCCWCSAILLILAHVLLFVPMPDILLQSQVLKCMSRGEVVEEEFLGSFNGLRCCRCFPHHAPELLSPAITPPWPPETWMRPWSLPLFSQADGEVVLLADGIAPLYALISASSLQSVTGNLCWPNSLALALLLCVLLVRTLIC